MHVLIALALLVGGTQLCDRGHRLIGYACFIGAPTVLFPHLMSRFADHWLQYFHQQGHAHTVIMVGLIALAAFWVARKLRIV
jgi:hypothetical protein